jgi:arylformamidase
MIYRNYNNQSEIDKEYNAISMVPDLKPYIEFDTRANEQVWKEFNRIFDVKYGPMCDEKLDIFPAENKNSPVFVYVHGGYWRSMNSRNFSLVAM